MILLLGFAFGAVGTAGVVCRLSMMAPKASVQTRPNEKAEDQGSDRSHSALALALSAIGMNSRQYLEIQGGHRPTDDLTGLGMATLLPRCDKCHKEFEKLLQCGRCKSAFYCSRECQNNAWKTHKNICRKPSEEPAEATIQLSRLAEKEAKPKPKSFVEPPVTVTKEDLEEPESDQQFRQELLRETKEINAKMMTVIQESGRNPAVFLPKVMSLKEEYHSQILSRISAKSGEQEDFAAEKLGEELMKEVIMAILQRGISGSADQLDLANNHFRAGILQQRSPSDFALQEGDLDGLEPAVSRVAQRGFVTIEGLLDEEIATAIHQECEEKFWKQSGAMSLAQGPADGIFECWLPFPARQGTSPELEHALRILFGLPHEFLRHGYATKLKVPTMAHLVCIPPGGREKLHRDFACDSGAAGRELTFSLFLAHQWKMEDGGALRARIDASEAIIHDPKDPKDPVQPADDPKSGDPEEEKRCFKDVLPEVGRCAIFRSRELWHEMLTPRHRLWVLTLFAYRA